MISDQQCLFIDGLILDPKKLFGKDRESLFSSDVGSILDTFSLMIDMCKTIYLAFDTTNLS